MKMGGGNSVAEKRKDLIYKEEDDLLQGVAAALNVTANRDSVISTSLSKLKLDPSNGRLGQPELMEQLDSLVECIALYVSTTGDKSVPEYITLKSKIAHTPALSKSAQTLFDTCANLANSYLPNGGHADNPPKVTSLTDGVHLVKTGNRRSIAYFLAQPITGVTTIDILIDKSKSSMDSLYQSIGRITENAARVDNTLAELILQFDYVLKLMEAGNKEINKKSLAQATGIERTKLGRIIEIIKCGFADEAALVLMLHDNKIEDSQSICLLVRQPKEQWHSLLIELISKGSAWFRSAYREVGNHDGGVQENKQVSTPVVDSSGVASSAGLDRQSSNVSNTNSENQKENGVSYTPPGSAQPKSTTINVKASAAKENSSSTKDAKERGAIKVLEILRASDQSLIISFENSGVETLEKLLIKLGQPK